MSTVLGFTWERLDRADLTPVAQAISCDWLIHAWGDVRAGLEERLERQSAGKAVSFVAYLDGRPVAVCGLSDYPVLPKAVQMATYVAPTHWGTDVNLRCKALLWALATEVVGLDSLVVSIDMANARSQAAAAKCWPNARWVRVDEPHHHRTGVMAQVTTPPVGAPALTAAELAALRGLAQGVLAVDRWRRFAASAP